MATRKRPEALNYVKENLHRNTRERIREIFAKRFPEEDFEEYLRIAVTDHDRLLAYDVARYRLYAAVSALVVAAIVAIGIAVELLHFRTGYHPWALFLPLAGVPAYNYVQLRRSQGRLLGDRVADGADGAW